MICFMLPAWRKFSWFKDFVFLLLAGVTILVIFAIRFLGEWPKVRLYTRNKNFINIYLKHTVI